MTSFLRALTFFSLLVVSNTAFAGVYYGWQFDSRGKMVCLSYSNQTGTLQTLGIVGGENCNEYFGWDMTTSLKAACFALDVNLDVISKSVADEYCAPANGWGLDLLSGFGCYGYRWKDNQPVAKLNSSLCEQKFGRSKGSFGVGRTKCYQLNHKNEPVRSAADEECTKRGK